MFSFLAVVLEVKSRIRVAQKIGCRVLDLDMADVLRMATRVSVISQRAVRYD
jgi:hypothetical protein